MEKSYEEGCKLLKLMDIDDVPIYHGAKDFIENRADLPTSEGSRFIIEEAMRECESRCILHCWKMSQDKSGI